MTTVTPSSGEVTPLVRTLNKTPDPITLFGKLTDDGVKPDTLLLESGDPTLSQGTKSLLVTSSALRIACHARDVEVEPLNANGESLVTWLGKQLQPYLVDQNATRLFFSFPKTPSGSERDRLRTPSPVDVLRTLATKQNLLTGQTSLGPIVCGVFSYDFLGSYESLPAGQDDLLQFSDFEFWLPDKLIEINHKKQTTTILRHVFGGKNASKVYNDMVSSLPDLIAEIEQLSDRTPPVVPQKHLAHQPNIEVDMDDQQFAAVVKLLKDRIIAGDVIQIVPSRTFSTSCPRPMAAYRCLRELNPSPYMFYVAGRTGTLFGASPETAVKVDGYSREIEIRPIAGTRSRARNSDGSIDPDRDSRLEADLRLNEKENAEHMMLVDLARNDVARVSKPGTRRVERLLSVERYSHVMHLVSHVKGQLEDDLDALHAYVATMNMGTLTGAPKIKAAQLLRQYESTRRGPYGGAVGYFAMDGQFDSSIIIRSALVKDKTAYIRAGAGVVYDSDPLAEADETRKKAQAVINAILAANQSEEEVS
jgi:anthranilate synthase component 1